MTLAKQNIVERVYNELGFLKNRQSSLFKLCFKGSSPAWNPVILSGQWFWNIQCERQEGTMDRNPATGADATLPARRVMAFKCSVKLRKKVKMK